MGGYVKINLKTGVIMYPCFKWLRTRPKERFLVIKYEICEFNGM